MDAKGNPTDSQVNGKKVSFLSGASTLYERTVNYKEGLDKAPVLGSIHPKFLGNWHNTFNYKTLQLVVALAAKFGGMVYSSTKDFGSWTGTLKSTLPGQSEEFGGVEFTTAAGVKRNDGVIYDGVYKQGTVINNVDISGMSHQEAVDAGYLRPASALAYYANSHSWFSGIRERSMYESSWISVQQVSLNYDLLANFAKRLKMNGLRVGVYANDLFFLYNNAPDNFNPYSINDSNSGAMNKGSAMPYIRRFGFTRNRTMGVNLYFKKKPAKRPVRIISLGSGGIGEKDIYPRFVIPPNQVSTFSLKIRTPEDQSLLYAWPHMHYLGKNFRAFGVTAKNDTIPLIHIPDWSFEWQEMYRMKKLVRIPAGSTINVVGTYDNTTSNPQNPNSPPKYVYSTNNMAPTDEMLTFLLIYAPYQEGDENISLE